MPGNHGQLQRVLTDGVATVFILGQPPMPWCECACSPGRGEAAPWLPTCRITPEPCCCCCALHMQPCPPHMVTPDQFTLPDIPMQQSPLLTSPGQCATRPGFGWEDGRAVPCGISFFAVGFDNQVRASCCYSRADMLSCSPVIKQRLIAVLFLMSVVGACCADCSRVSSAVTASPLPGSSPHGPLTASRALVSTRRT